MQLNVIGFSGQSRLTERPLLRGWGTAVIEVPSPSVSVVASTMMVLSQRGTIIPPLYPGQVHEVCLGFLAALAGSSHVSELMHAAFTVSVFILAFCCRRQQLLSVGFTPSKTALCLDGRFSFSHLAADDLQDEVTW